MGVLYIRERRPPWLKKLVQINSEVRNYDIITGLPLRRTFWDIADRVLMQDERKYCMLAIDVENFHFINKWFGRNTGDELLERIQKDLSEIVFRFKGSGSFRTIFSAYKTKDKNITAGDMCDYTNIALHAIKNRPDVTFCWYSPVDKYIWEKVCQTIRKWMNQGTPTWMRILMFVYKDKGTGDVCAKEIVMNIDEAKRLELELWIKNTRK